MGEQERAQRYRIMDAMEDDRRARTQYALRSSGYGMSSEEDYRRRLAEQAGRHRGRGPRGYRRSDERVGEDLHERLTDDPALDATEVQVQVTQGEVVLTGTVESRAARRRAEDIAENVFGVEHVTNNLRVRQPSTDRATG
jgi:osmotically-inducible protein OsmY